MVLQSIVGTMFDASATRNFAVRWKASAFAALPVGIMLWADAHAGATVAEGAGGVVSVTEWSRDLLENLIRISAAMVAVQFVWSLLPLRFRPLPWLVVGAALICAIAWWGVSFFSLFGYHMSSGHGCVARDGSVWRCGANWDGGYQLLRDRETHWYCNVSDVVAEELDRDGRGAQLVRPSPRASEAGVVCDSAGRIYGIGEGGYCLVATDPGAPPRAAAGYSSETGAQLRAIRAAEISPFVLIDRDGTGYEPDVQRVLDAIDEARRHPEIDPGFRVGTWWFPPERALLAALDDSNPWIAATARRFITAGGTDLYPTAASRLK